MPEKIVVSKHWNKPTISVALERDGIDIKIKLDDFILAVMQEVGSVTWTFRDKTFHKKLNDAMEKVLTEMKDMTKLVI